MVAQDKAQLQNNFDIYFFDLKIKINYTFGYAVQKNFKINNARHENICSSKNVNNIMF